jgi:putative SOS response-associated peptidase YedK
MCGRFVLISDVDALQLAFNLTDIPQIMPSRFNIAPSQPVAVITNDAPQTLSLFRWGLIPFWAKDPGISASLINARAETAADKPAFRAAFKRRRCLVPTDGFFEWQKSDRGKVPLFIHLRDRRPFAFAGLWETWYSPEGDEVRTCTILTTAANSFMEPIHNRMPAILPPEHYDTWLLPDEQPASVLQPLLQPYDPDQMAAYTVSSFVNNPRNDTPECIEPAV